MFRIIDRQTGAQVGKLYRQRRTATNRADRLDNEYGAYRYFVEEVLDRRPARPADPFLVPMGDPSNPTTLTVDCINETVSLSYGDGSARVVAFPTAEQIDAAIAALQALRSTAR